MMKRDMNLIREILFQIEAQDRGYLNLQKDEDYNDFSEDKKNVNYHILILTEGGLLNGSPLGNLSSPIPQGFTGVRITWEGHEFIDLARDNARWEKAMSQVKEKGSTITIGVLTQILSSIAKHTFGIE